MKWRANIRRLFLVGQKKELNLKVFNGITEAPDDGEQYVRKNRRWAKLFTSSVPIDDTVTIELANRASTIDISNWGNEAFDIKSGTIVLSGELMFENEAGDEKPGTPNLRVFVNGTTNADRVLFYDLVFNSNTRTPYFGDVYGAAYLRYYNPHRFQITITFSKKLYVTMTAYGGSQDDNDKRTYKVLESTSEYNSNDSIKQISIGIVAPIYASAGSKIRVAQIN